MKCTLVDTFEFIRGTLSVAAMVSCRALYAAAVVILWLVIMGVLYSKSQTAETLEVSELHRQLRKALERVGELTYENEELVKESKAIK